MIDGSASAYQLDPAGNRTTLTASGGDASAWQYDAINQLLVEKRTLSADTFTHTLTYDSRGNRVTLSDAASPPVSVEYGPFHKFCNTCIDTK